MVGFAPGASTTACGAEKRVRVDVGSANGLRDEPGEEQPASLGRAAAVRIDVYSFVIEPKGSRSELMGP